MTKDNDRMRVVSSKQTSRDGGDKLPPLVTQVRDNAISILMSYLDQLFSSCDDLFFDLSSRATNNNEQNLYFESMRELRIKKNGVITQYRQHIEHLFANASNGKAAASRPQPSGPQREEGLSLVQHDEVEQDVAITSMVSKARVNNQEALRQLNVRLDYLLTDTAIDADSNPLDPQQLCQAFAQACELLDINIKARIILYKQFDRHIASRLANLYSNANDLLINAGVIPHVSRTVNKSAGEASAGAEATDEQAETTYQRSDVQFDELAQLLSSLRTLGVQNFPGYHAYTGNPGPTMSNNELLAAITLLQQEFNAGTDELYIHRLVEEVLTQSNPQSPQSVQQADEDTINLVSMFFDFVLDDRNLSTAIQALISRLQIPILKVALKDRSFFNNSNHPARKLVNRLAEISIGLDDGDDLKQDKIYQLVAQVVQDVQEQHATDSRIFAVKLDQVERFATQHAHRSELIEKRTAQTEEGKARTEEARSATQSLLLEKLFSAQLPTEVFDFLVEQWQQLLTLTHLKHGEESPEWLEAVQVVQDLIWACQPHEDEKSKTRLARIRGHLVHRITSGLRKIAVTEQEAGELADSIGAIIDACQQPGEAPPLQSMNPQQAKALGHTPGAGTKSWKNMNALERQQARHKRLTYEYIKKAEEVALNSWFTYEDIQSGQTLRCKLSARIEAADQYIFVNRLGFKVLTRSRKDFAYDMQRGRARRLHTEPLFDRAMSRIRNTLKQPSVQSGGQ